jgi:hypothetical protein
MKATFTVIHAKLEMILMVNHFSSNRFPRKCGPIEAVLKDSRSVSV